MAYASKNGLGQELGLGAAFEVCKQALENLDAGKPFPTETRLRMFESYEGVVKHVDDDQVVVVYEVEDDLVEQTYLAKQFIDNELPKVGERLAVFVHVARLPDQQDETEGEEVSDEQRRRPKNFVPLPRVV